ncbi:diguanylate cyclase [Desulforhopalus vacuolatus]|uniref:sensor domain-containing diguanylate cyclase n=1 Tax=Desulforhopalus vacuolatus TaxID=40414 RepID=UPI0019660B8D|nr:sensor domain-containing diguanylate cyclase [Desulforhopalus vacuolatus]MBM9519423.1 diguanylate cyclase [Desulforhopalus vacuolatus]
MNSRQILEDLNTCFEEAMQRGLGQKGLIFPIDLDNVDDDELKHICVRLAAIFDMLNESYHYSEKLAKGDLKAKPSRTNIFAMPLKGLQASLTHLTWQANQVAEGDLSQQVHFLGRFSDSFNHMIKSLREKEVIEQRLKLISNVIGEGIFLVTSEGKIIFLNPEASRLLGYFPDEIENKFIHEIIHTQRLDGSFYQPGDNPIFNAITHGDKYNNTDGCFTCKSGLLMPVMIACRPVFKEDILDGAVIAFRDITEQKNYLKSLETINSLLEKQASTDTLTGIYNRMKFDEKLMIEIKRAHRYNSPLSFVMFDIDNFKKVNDTYGHLAGDNVLKRLAGLVAANIRDTDIFARWGGEEFVIQLPGLSLARAIIFAEKLRHKIEKYNFKEPEKITVSFGVTVFQARDNNITLTNRADAALYRAKENGRNQVRSSNE